MKDDKELDEVLKKEIDAEIDEYQDEESEILDEEDNLSDQLAFKDARILELEQTIEEHKASYLRKHADFENFRKRILKEKSESIKLANESLINDLIEVIDNFDRALQSANDSEDFASFKQGIEMIEKQFKGMLSSNWGLSKIESVGKEFDPQIHEAMFMEDSKDVEVPTVSEEFQSGYMLHDKVLRAPKVKVSKPAEV